MDIAKSGIKDFERIARRYGVDFAVTKDKSVQLPRYTVFFKAKDADALKLIHKAYSAKIMKKRSRPSVLAQLQKFKALATNFGEAWRLAVGTDISEKILALFGTIPAAFGNPIPSMHPVDLCVGLVCGAVLRTAVYLRGKNAKKYRHNVE